MPRIYPRSRGLPILTWAIHPPFTPPTSVHLTSPLPIISRPCPVAAPRPASELMYQPAPAPPEQNDGSRQVRPAPTPAGGRGHRRSPGPGCIPMSIRSRPPKASSATVRGGVRRHFGPDHPPARENGDLSPPRIPRAGLEASARDPDAEEIVPVGPHGFGAASGATCSGRASDCGRSPDGTYKRAHVLDVGARITQPLHQRSRTQPGALLHGKLLAHSRGGYADSVQKARQASEPMTSSRRCRP